MLCFDKKNKKHVVGAIVGAVVIVVLLIVAIYFLFINEDTKVGGRGEPDAKSLELYDGDEEEYQKQSTVLHNRYRYKHYADPLRLSKELNEIAVKCAEYYSAQGMIDHSCPYKQTKAGERVGENLYQGGVMPGKEGNPVEEAKQATTMWYDENTSYDYSESDPSNFMAVGHFTQVVWKGTKELGIGYATNGRSTFVAGIYAPPGNYQGMYKENVSKP